MHASAVAHTVDRVCVAASCNDHWEGTDDEETLLADLLAERGTSKHYWHQCTVDNASEAQKLEGSPSHHSAAADAATNTGHQKHPYCVIHFEVGVDVGDTASHLSSCSGGVCNDHEICYDSLGCLYLQTSLQSALVHDDGNADADVGVVFVVCDEL